MPSFWWIKTSNVNVGRFINVDPAGTLSGFCWNSFKEAEAAVDEDPIEVTAGAISIFSFPDEMDVDDETGFDGRSSASCRSSITPANFMPVGDEVVVKFDGAVVARLDLVLFEEVETDFVVGETSKVSTARARLASITSIGSSFFRVFRAAEVLVANGVTTVDSDLVSSPTIRMNEI